MGKRVFDVHEWCTTYRDLVRLDLAFHHWLSTDRRRHSLVEGSSVAGVLSLLHLCGQHAQDSQAHSLESSILRSGHMLELLRLQYR